MAKKVFQRGTRHASRAIRRGSSPVVLVMEDDVLKRLATAADLRHNGLEVFEAAGIEEAKTILKSIAIDVLFSNVSLADGRKLLSFVKEEQLTTRTFVFADTGPAERARKLQS
jgi:response regulator RpfG family c-di-GMP phosphodiesterase